MTGVQTCALPIYAVSQDGNDGALRTPAQGSRHEVGRWHEAVGILVMFIHAESIKTALLGKFQLI